MIKIIICDDHQLMIDGIKLILSEDEEMQCVGEALNGQQAIDIIANKGEVDIIIMDINMPILNGLEACKIISKEHPEVKVIGLSMLKDIQLIKSMVQYGAKGYLLKNSGQEEVLKTIHEVYEGRMSFDQNLIADLLKYDKKARKKSSTSLFPKLSRREKEILKLVMDEHTTSEIAKMLFISSGTVETHRKNINTKLGVRNTAGLVRVAMEYNILAPEEL